MLFHYSIGQSSIGGVVPSCCDVFPSNIMERCRAMEATNCWRDACIMKDGTSKHLITKQGQKCYCLPIGISLKFVSPLNFQKQVLFHQIELTEKSRCSKQNYNPLKRHSSPIYSCTFCVHDTSYEFISDRFGGT